MLSIAIHAFGQIADSSASNYLFYTQQMDAIFDSLNQNTPDSIQIAGYKSYKRQKDFWEPGYMNGTD